MNKSIPTFAELKELNYAISYKGKTLDKLKAAYTDALNTYNTSLDEYNVMVIKFNAMNEAYKQQNS